MDRHSDRNFAVARAQWLAELAASTAEAKRLAGALAELSGHSEELRDLQTRIDAATREVDSLQRGRTPVQRRAINPFWISFRPWGGSPEDLIGGSAFD